ncbi:Flp pilus assembly protein CpaB [Raineyella fluvialis]|uniref:Flp pilus assembly protein CpaB n=1 Tax=Raineyella fluvialis TaxID=2662261 RepID=UPI0018901C2C|nr:RcpC/CpaB family pilus assembly protein [Raineyella fluvialis]
MIALVVLIAYVGGADRRALRTLQPESVLVVVQPVAKGTAADALGNAVQVKQIPHSAKAQGAVSAVSELGKRVSAVDLVPGEQVLSSRFVDQANLQSAQVPAGMQEVTVLLTSQRVYGGRPTPGDKVGIFLTDNQAKTTKLGLNGVLVTRVQGGAQLQASTPAAGSASAAQSSSASEVNIMITVALNTHDAERLVWAAENGKVWMSLQNKATDTAGSSVVNPDNFAR